MTGISAGGGLSARGLSAKGIEGGAKGQAVGGGGGAHEPGQKPQPHGGDFGRNGALSRGQGFSQRDAFTPAKQAQQPHQAGGAHRAHASGAKPQDQAAALHQQQAQQPQAQKSSPQQAQQPQAQRNPSQESTKQQQAQQAEAMKLWQQNAVRQLELQGMNINQMMQQHRLEDQQLMLEIIQRIRKQLMEWVKQLFELFAQPATH